VRTVPVAAPTRDVATLVSLVRLALETAPPAAAVEGIVVRTSPARTRSAQLSFFEPAGPSPDKLASTIARLQALVGETRVGAPVVLDRHLPDAFAMQPFDAPRLPAGGGRALSDDDARALSLHSLRPPVDAEVRLDRGELRYLAGQGVGGQVLAAAGPFRVRDGWWQLPVSRDYYDVQLSDGAIYRVFHDLSRDSWHIDGCYE
jgi:protein ImuB